LHLAADTSFASKESNWRVNFDGTMALAEAATRMPRLTRFLHCSTATICGADAGDLVHEAEYPRAGVAHLVHYTHAKAEAEMALAQRFGGLPVVVVRPSIVAGHSTLGAKPSTSIFWFLRAVEALGLTSCEPTGGIDIVPSDWTAAALLHLLFKPELAERCYHLSAGIGSRSHWPAMLAAFAAARGPGAQITPARTFDMTKADVLRRRFRSVFGHGDARLALMLRACRKYYEFCALDATFDNARILAEGMAPPPAMPEYLAICLANPPGQSVFEAFLEDADMFVPEVVVPQLAAE
jgi:nucleoside-diphosphate-sugar epimerase